MKSFLIFSLGLLGVVLAVSRPSLRSEGGPIPRAITQNLTADNPYEAAGVWGPLDFCLEGSFVEAFELMYAPPGHLDETAVNVVKLYCKTQDGQDTGYITSLTGSHGDFYGMRICNGSFVTGFRANTLQHQGLFSDNVAVEDVEIDCNYGREILSSGIPPLAQTKSPTSRDFGMGVWSTFATCRDDSAVCGIQTRYQDAGLGDELAIVEVVLFCCDVPVTPASRTAVKN